MAKKKKLTLGQEIERQRELKRRREQYRARKNRLLREEDRLASERERSKTIQSFADEVRTEIMVELSDRDICESVLGLELSDDQDGLLLQVYLGDNLFWRISIPLTIRQHFSAATLVDSLCDDVARFAGK